MIRIGPAGWSYRDWEGIVYPPSRPRTQHPLALIARLFDVVEVNATFYSPPSPTAARTWCDLLDRLEAERFQFAVKLWRGLTHEPNLPDQGEVTRLGDLCDVLAERGRLGAVLAQFPWSFKNVEPNRQRLASLVDAWEGCPLAIEVRHGSWESEGFVGWLRERGVALVNIDQPVIGESLGPAQHVTSPHLAYVRLHGQNREQWFAEEAGVEERYNYLYSAEELGPWADRVSAMAAEAKETVVITNNHFRGQAVANALELQSALLPERDVPVPPCLIERFPRLRSVPGLRTGKDDDFTVPAFSAGDDGQLEMF